MVYSIGRIVPFEDYEPRHHVIGENEGVWDKIEYLHPETVDIIAKARRNPLFGYGHPIAPDTAPKAVVWQSKTKLPPDYAFGNNQVMLVSSKFRDLVERFEPGVHQFLPVSMYYSEADTEPFDEFYWFVCCTLIDSLDPENTTYTWDGEYETRKADGFRLGSWYFDQSITPKQEAVFSLKAIGDHHLWRDPHIAGRVMVYCSDSFAEALQSAELSGFGLTQREQV